MACVRISHCQGKKVYVSFLIIQKSPYSNSCILQKQTKVDCQFNFLIRLQSEKEILFQVVAGNSLIYHLQDFYLYSQVKMLVVMGPGCGKKNLRSCGSREISKILKKRSK